MNKSNLLLVILFFHFSCVDKQAEATLTSCYFQVEYVNYAWGFQHSGFTITPAGEIYSFNKPAAWVFATEGKLSAADLKKNIAASVKADTLVNSSDLEYYRKLVLPASLGKLSQPVTQGADIGGYSYRVFIPDSADSSPNFREVYLSKDGDIEQHNLSPEAAVIVVWLKKFRIH